MSNNNTTLIIPYAPGRVILQFWRVKIGTGWGLNFEKFKTLKQRSTCMTFLCNTCIKSTLRSLALFHYKTQWKNVPSVSTRSTALDFFRTGFTGELWKTSEIKQVKIFIFLSHRKKIDLHYSIAVLYFGTQLGKADVVISRLY